MVSQNGKKMNTLNSEIEGYSRLSAVVDVFEVMTS